MENHTLLKEIEELTKKLTGDMIKDMQTREDIHKKQMQMHGTKPKTEYFDCIGCGS